MNQIKYQTQDRDLDNSIDPVLWGPSTWASLHWVAAAYPASPTVEEKQHYKMYFEMLQYTLPCSECREHYSQLIKQMPIDSFLISGKQLRQWLVSIHNTVNARNNKAERWTVADVDRKFPPANHADTFVAPPSRPQVSSNGRSTISLQIQKSIAAPVSSSSQFTPSVPNQTQIQDISRLLRQKQNLIQNNAKTLGLVQKFNYIGASSLNVRKRRSVVIPAKSREPQSVKKKKKGCGCNNKNKH